MHRLGQVQISAGASRAVLDRWRQVSPIALGGTAGPWLADSVALTRTYRRRSRRLTADYVRLLRALRTGETLPPLEGGPVRDEASLGELRDHFAASAGASRRPHRDDAVRVSVDTNFAWPQADADAEDRRATVSLVVTGPVAAERRISRLRADQQQRGRLDDADFLAELDGIMRDVGAGAAGAADRDAQMGGRDLMEESSRSDRAVIGWARVTDADPCWLCGMLAGRGAVYRSFWTARYRGTASRRKAAAPGPPQGWEDWSPQHLAQWETSKGLNRFHNNCHCTLVPVYSRTDWVPEASRAYRELYDSVTEGLNAPEARAAFRAAMEARRRRVRSRNVTV